MNTLLSGLNFFFFFHIPFSITILCFLWGVYNTPLPLIDHYSLAAFAMCNRSSKQNVTTPTVLNMRFAFPDIEYITLTLIPDIRTKCIKLTRNLGIHIWPFIHSFCIQINMLGILDLVIVTNRCRVKCLLNRQCLCPCFLA